MDGYSEFAAYFNNILMEKRPKATQSKIANELGVMQGTISKIRRGYMIPGDELAEKIAKIWNINDFMEKVNEARKKYSYSARKNEKRDDINEVKIKTKPRLPISAAAGILKDYLKGPLAQFCEQIPIIRSIPDYDFTILVKGNSMEPKYEYNDEIACKKVVSIIEWGKTYVVDTKDGAFLRRLYKTENGVKCVSYNNIEYPEFEIKNDNILGIYRVVGLIRL